MPALTFPTWIFATVPRAPLRAKQNLRIPAREITTPGKKSKSTRQCQSVPKPFNSALHKIVTWSFGEGSPLTCFTFIDRGVARLTGECAVSLFWGNKPVDTSIS